MLLFLAGVVEQLDLALEHIGKGDVHNARFGLMLTDNALELVLHQIVRNKRTEAGSWRYREKPYPYESQLRKAFLGSFSDKVAFARIEGGLSADVARTFNILHEYRNDIYHAGLAHHSILSSLARFYFATTCTFLAEYNPVGFGWTSSQEIPERAQKYFKGDRIFPGMPEDFPKACKTMAVAIDFDGREIAEALADDMHQIVEDIDKCIQIIADGVYVGQKTTRHHAILSTQAWDLAFSEEGRTFLAAKKFEGSKLQAIDFLIEKYPFGYQGDPILGWQAQAKKLRAKDETHMALDHYQSFVKQTGHLRAALEQSAGAIEVEIDAAIDRMRDK